MELADFSLKYQLYLDNYTVISHKCISDEI